MILRLLANVLLEICGWILGKPRFLRIAAKWAEEQGDVKAAREFRSHAVWLETKR